MLLLYKNTTNDFVGRDEGTITIIKVNPIYRKIMNTNIQLHIISLYISYIYIWTSLVAR